MSLVKKLEKRDYFVREIKMRHDGAERSLLRLWKRCQSNGKSHLCEASSFTECWCVQTGLTVQSLLSIAEL